MNDSCHTWAFNIINPPNREDMRELILRHAIIVLVRS